MAASILQIGAGTLAGVVMAAYQLKVVGVILAAGVQRDAMVRLEPRSVASYRPRG